MKNILQNQSEFTQVQVLEHIISCATVLFFIVYSDLDLLSCKVEFSNKHIQIYSH